MNIISKWTSNLKQEDKPGFEATLKNSTVVLSRLKQILLDSDREIRSKESLDAFESPSWAYMQAFLNGRKEENRQILKLLEFVD